MLCWLSDLTRWGRIIARYLKPGSAPTTRERRTLHIFVIDGENVGSEMNGASPDGPRSLGRPRRRDFKLSEAYDYGQASTLRSDELVGACCYGGVRVGKTRQVP